MVLQGEGLREIKTYVAGFGWVSIFS